MEVVKDVPLIYCDGSCAYCLRVIVTTSGIQMTVRDSGATRIFFKKKNRMMQHWAQKLTTKFKLRFSFRLDEKNIEILAQKPSLNGLSISDDQKFVHQRWPKK